MPSKKHSWFKKIRNKLKRKKKREKTVFGQRIKKTKKTKRNFIGYLKNLAGSFRRKIFWFFPKRKIHLKYFLKIKRWIAFTLSLLYLAIGITMFPEQMSLVFFISSYIFLDYTWKTRSIDWTKEE